jgi:hypothetical protein
MENIMFLSNDGYELIDKVKTFLIQPLRDEIKAIKSKPEYKAEALAEILNCKSLIEQYTENRKHAISQLAVYELLYQLYDKLNELNLSPYIGGVDTDLNEDDVKLSKDTVLNNITGYKSDIEKYNAFLTKSAECDTILCNFAYDTIPDETKLKFGITALNDRITTIVNAVAIVSRLYQVEEGALVSDSYDKILADVLATVITLTNKQ